MFQFNEISPGSGGGAAALSLDRTLLRRPLAGGFGTRAPLAPATLSLPSFDFDLVVDLGDRIGSRSWLRGLATCAALCYTAYSFAPGLDPIAGAAPAPLSEAQWEQARAYSISPLAYGADTGRRMAPTEAVQTLADTPERPSIDLVATLGRGDGFTRVLERAGLSEAEADEVTAIVGRATDVDAVKPGTPMQVTLGRRLDKRVARPLQSLAFRARFDLKLALARVDGRLILTRIPIAVDNTPLRIQGRVGSSLYRAARAAGAPAKAVEAYLKAIATQVSVDAVGADDRFDIIIEHRRAATGETESGQLLYAGLDRSRAKDLQLMQWTQDGRTQWFEASGVGKASGLLQRPVPGAVSSNFGMRRHPILGYSRMHKGMDFRGGYGTPILAAADGRVVRAGWSGGYGRQVRLDHSGGIATSYSHMSRVVARAGAFVRQGQVIGYIGATGLATGPHLHYELYRNGAPVNPMSVKFTQRAQLGGGDLAAFRSKLRGLLSVRAGGAPAPVRTASAETKKKLA